ncbi:MAG TPA: xanthine dehydrogenase family protein molybdopterin-binding subunit [Rhodocyclaceae bacterium]|nr:xanthine dehydrogenase family protein molybdopterin-binding subunit [Rhodocyclaceae bacterium]
MKTIENLSRREFLVTGAGLTLGVWLGEMPSAWAAGVSAKAEVFAPNAFVRIGSDNTVTVVAKHLEMGQGTHTGLPTLVADELDAAWSQIRVEAAPADASRYNNLNWGAAQGTGGSSAIANSFEQMRRAGATARAMLVAAAAQEWRVPADSIRVSQGVLSHRSGKKATFGQMAARAAALPVPEQVKLKEAKDFIYIGKRFPRTDSRVKTEGKALFTQDLHLPDMVVAVVAHPPRFGGKVKSFDAARTKGVAGVLDVVAIPSGVAVLGKDFWSARRGRDLLAVDWDESQASHLNSSDIIARYRDLAQQPGAVAANRGDAAKALAGAAKLLTAEFDFPYLAHASMEPLDCVVQLGREGCEIWNGDQAQTFDQNALAGLLGLAPAQVKINTLYAGGSFGRRANPHSDYVVEAASIAKALLGGPLAGKPVKLQWTREDDTRAGFFRPVYLHRLRAGLDADGQLEAWEQRIVGQSILAGSPFAAVMVKNGIDATSVEGAVNLPYAVPDFRVELNTVELPVPVQWWRSVGSTHTAFATEAFLDELAQAAGQDPVAWRRQLLQDHPRHRGVLDLAAEKAGWGRPLAPGKTGEKRGRGVAVHESFNTYVAQVAEVTVRPDGSFRVDRVVCAVDCGVPVNPDVIEAQMEGGIVFGLSAALHGAITLRDGQVEQSNFHDYPVLRLNEMPRVEVHIVPSQAKPTGVGEPATPVIAPALANALFAATGQRLRSLPFKVA